MKCSNCGHHNPAGTTFCFKCVQKLTHTPLASADLLKRRVLLAPRETDSPIPSSPPKTSRVAEILSWLMIITAIVLLAYALWPSE